MKVSTIMRKRATLSVATLVALSALAGTTQASHWTQYGGGETHPGFQPTDPAQLPLEYRNRGGSGVISPIVSGGATLADQRIVYSSQSTFIVDESTWFSVHRFTDGGLVDEYDLDNDTVQDPDGWGTTNFVSPVVASDHNSAGQSYGVYNDDDTSSDADPNPGQNDISIAQIDNASGALVADAAIGGPLPANFLGGTDGYTIDSPPVISGDLGDGSRKIVAIIRNDDSTERAILQLTIPDATASTNNVSGARLSFEISNNIPDANVLASPSLLRLRDPVSGSRVMYIAVPTADGVKTFRSSNINSPGPSISGLGLTWHVSSPVRADGNTPGSWPCPVLPEGPDPRPACSLPIYTISQTASEATVVRKLMQDESDVFDAAKLATFIPVDEDSTSPELPGKPARALAVEQNIPTGGAASGVPQPGRVIASTSGNIYSLDTENLADPDPARVFPVDREVGFDKTMPAASGGLAFTTDNAGQQFVFYTDPTDRGTLRVTPDETGFMPHEEALNSTSSISQPAVSRGRVVFGANNGFFTYGPNVAITRPSANARVSGNDVPLEAYVFNPTLASTTFFVDGEEVGTDAVNDDRLFTVTWDSLSVLDGTHTLRAEATDGVETQVSANRTFIVDNFQDPKAALTVSPAPANPGQTVTLDASGSAPTESEEGETIVEWAFELDGDNDFDDLIESADEGGDGRIARTFEPGTRVVGVRVTDSHGDVDDQVETLRVNVPPAANLAVGPNPAAEGQEVTVDASASTDVDGSITKYEFDLNGDGSFELDNGANPKVQRVFAPGSTKLTARVTDNEGASSLVEATLVVSANPGNQVPAASFVATPNPAKTDQRVLFDASAVRDVDGTIVKFEWDLDGNGTFETNSQNNPRVQRSYATPKTYDVKLRVTDNAGAVSAVFTRQLVVGGVVPRKSPRRLTAKVTPKRDAAAPFRFRTSGSLLRPRGITRKAGCTGRVTVVVKAGKKTISRRTTKLRRNCTYRVNVSFRDTTRFGTASRLRFTARFQGNKVLRARQAKSVRVRFR